MVSRFDVTRVPATRVMATGGRRVPSRTSYLDSHLPAVADVIASYVDLRGYLV